MEANFKKNKQEENELTNSARKPAVLVAGRMPLTKKFSLKYFSNMIAKFGVLKDFVTISKTELNFFVDIKTLKISALLKALEIDNYYIVDEIKDLRITHKTNLIELILLITVQVE